MAKQSKAQAQPITLADIGGYIDQTLEIINMIAKYLKSEHDMALRSHSLSLGATLEELSTTAGHLAASAITLQRQFHEGHAGSHMISRFRLIEPETVVHTRQLIVELVRNVSASVAKLEVSGTVRADGIAYSLLN